MDQYISAIQAVGFPIVVALILLLRLGKMADETRVSTDRLADSVARLTQCIVSLYTLIDERIPRK